MENYVVVSKNAVSKQDRERLVLRFGGHWFNDLGEFGVVQRADARIEVYHCDLDDYSPAEQEALQLILGGEPKSATSVAYSSNEPSEELAREFCASMIDEFGGYFDNNVDDVAAAF